MRRVRDRNSVQAKFRRDAFTYSKTLEDVHIEIEQARAYPIRDICHRTQGSLRRINKKQLTVIGHCLECASALKSLLSRQRVAERIIHLFQEVAVVIHNASAVLDNVTGIFRQWHHRGAIIGAADRIATAGDAQITSGSHRENPAKLPTSKYLANYTCNAGCSRKTLVTGTD